MASWLDNAEFETQDAPDWLASADFEPVESSPQVTAIQGNEPDPSEGLSLRDYASGRGSQFLGAMAQSGAGLLETIYDWSPPGQVYNALGRDYKKPGVAPIREFGEDMTSTAELLKPKHPALKWVTDVVDGTLQMAPSVVTSMVTKSPNAGLSAMGGQVFGQVYNDEMANGATPDEAALKAMRSTAYEIGPEKMFGFFDRLGVTGGVKKYLTQIVAEAGSEFVTEALSIGDETVIQGEKFKGWVDFLERTGYAASVGAGMGAGLSLGSLQKGNEEAAPALDVLPANISDEEAALDEISRRTLAEEATRNDWMENAEFETADEQLPVVYPDPIELPEPVMAEEIPVEDAGEQLPVAEIEPELLPIPLQAEEIEDAGEQLPVEEIAPLEPTNEPDSAPTAEPEAWVAQPDLTKSVSRSQTPLAKDENGNWTEFDPRMMREDYRAPLKHMLQELIKGGGMGIVQVGGNKRADGSTKQEYEDTVRLPSSNPAWFQGLSSNIGITVDQLKGAVNKALSGNVKLGTRQAEAIKSMLNMIREGRTGFDDKYGPQYDTWREMLAGSREARDMANADKADAIETMPDWNEELGAVASNFFDDVMDEEDAKLNPKPETAPAESSAQTSQETERKQIEPSAKAQESLSIEGAKDSDRLHNLKEQKDAERKGLDKPYVAPDKGPGGLFDVKEEAPVQLDVEDAAFGSENKLFKENPTIKPGQLNDITQVLVIATQKAGFYVEGGIRDFAAFSKKMIAEFGDKIKPYLKNLFENAMQAVGPTSNKEEQVDKERAARGQAPVGKPELPSVDEMNESALAELKNDETLGPTTINDILNDPNPMIGDRQNSVMAMYRRQVMNRRDKWAEKAENGDIDAKREYDIAEGEIERIDRAAAITRSQWGRWGVIQQQMINQDFSREVLERKARVANQGPLNQEQIKEIKVKSEILAKDQERLLEAEEKQATNIVHLEFSEAYKQMQKRVESRLKSQNREKLHAEGQKNIKEGLEELSSLGFFSNPLADPRTYAALIKVTRGYIQDFSADVQDFIAFIRSKAKPEFNNAVTDEALVALHLDTMMEMDREGEKPARKKGKKKAAPKTPVTPADVITEIETFAEAGDPLSQSLIVKLALAFILDGVRGENAVMAAVTEALQGSYPGITEHEVRLEFTKYGRTIVPSQEDHHRELREIKTLVRLQESIDRLNADRDALKTGFQRDKATQKIRERQKVLNILLRERAKKNPVMSAEKLASVEETRLTRLRNRVADLEKQVATGERPGPRVEVDDSPAVAKLKEKIEILKKTIKMIDDAKNPPISPEEKQLNNLAELRDHLDKVLENREAAKEQKQFVPLTKEAADLKGEIDELRKAVATMRRFLKDPRTTDEKLEAAKIKALEEAIDKYDQRIAAGDFSVLYEKKDVPVTERVRALRLLRDARRDVYLAAKKASKPIMSREERINRQRMAALLRRQAELTERIQNKDFSEKPKRQIVEDDKAVAKLRFQVDEQKAEFNAMLAKYRFDKMGWFKQKLVQGVKLLNLSRAVITAVDLSAALRQGGIVVLAHPSLFKKGFMPMLRAFRSKENAHKINTEIQGRKNANLYKRSKLFIAEQNTSDLSKMEEVYMSTWAEKIPLIAGSGRAYVTFLNKLRADAFDMMLDTLTHDGHTATEEELKAIANYVNVATGRGKINVLGLLKLKEDSDAGAHLATVFFAPKYVASRFNFLFGQPMYAAPNSVRVMIAKEYARYFAGVSIVLSLAAMAAAAFRDDDDEREVISFDPRSSNFLKVRFGDTRIDLMSGLIQPTVLLTRILAGQTKTGRGDVKALRNWWRLPTGDIDKYAGVEYGNSTVSGVVGTFTRSKFAPFPGFLLNFWDGKNVVGQQVDPLIDSLAMFAPLSLRDFSGMIEENGVPGAIALQTLVTFGAGAQTYGDGGWSEQRGAIDKKIQEIKDQVTAEPTAKAKREKFKELEKEYPWLLSGASLDTYKRTETTKVYRKRLEEDPAAVKYRRGDVKETASGVKIKDLPEAIKGDKTELISDINSAMRKLQKQTKLSDIADMADYSPTLKKALESGDVDTGMWRGMKIAKELENSARQIKKDNISEIRRAKRVAN